MFRFCFDCDFISVCRFWQFVRLDVPSDIQGLQHWPLIPLRASESVGDIKAESKSPSNERSQELASVSLLPLILCPPSQEAWAQTDVCSLSEFILTRVVAEIAHRVG